MVLTQLTAGLTTFLYVSVHCDWRIATDAMA